MGPLDPEEEERRARRESRQAWRTPSGFQTAGLHSMGTTWPLRLPPTSAATEVGGKSGAWAGVHGASPDLLLPDTGVEGEGPVRQLAGAGVPSPLTEARSLQPCALS